VRHIVSRGEGVELFDVAVMTECVGPPSRVLQASDSNLAEGTGGTGALKG
jgi:hypothetical protein